jgi:RNA polymerase sigma-70 factor (sigma-E family)
VGDEPLEDGGTDVVVRQRSAPEAENASDAFDAFARARMRELLRFAHVLTGDPHRAADLVQDALEKTLLSWDRIIRKDDPEGYVRRAIVNRHVSVWRRTRRERLVADTPDRPHEGARPHDDELWAALATLPPRQRAVLALRYYEELSEADTAAVLGCTVGTVKSQAFRALAKLRDRATTDTEGVRSWTL